MEDRNGSATDDPRVPDLQDEGTYPPAGLEPDEAPAEDDETTAEPFYRRPAWIRVFLVLALFAMWLILGLLFTPRFWRF
jgi:hypothetical protein